MHMLSLNYLHIEMKLPWDQYALCLLSPFSLRTPLGQEDDWESENENIFLVLQSFFFFFTATD